MKSNRSARSALLLAAVLFSFFSFSSLTAQVRIDVKTKWLEKKELTAAKHGVIAAIEADPAIAVTEFGEDYALWIKNLHRTKEGKERVVVTLDLELRKPSLMGEGELIEKKEVRLRYDSRVLDSLRSERGTAATITAQREEHDYWNRLIGTAIGNLVPKGGAFVVPVLTALLHNVNAPPSPEEVCEAVLIGAYAAEWVGSRVVE